MTEQTSRLTIIIDSSGAKKQADSLTVALDKMTQSGDKAVASITEVSRATDEEKQALNKLRAAIDPVGAAINTVGRRFSELKKYFDKGLIDEEEFRTLSKMLNDTTDELSGVAQAQREAEKAGKLATAQQEAQAQAFQRMIDRIDPLTAALRNLDQQQNELSAALSSGKINTAQFDAYSSKLQETRKEVTGEAQAQREAAKAHDEQVAALRRLEAQLDPVGEGFRRLAQQQKQLDSAKASGLLSTESYGKLSGTLNEMRGELEKTQAQLGKTSMSAKQTAFAMRMIPAQMTDIVVGLSTGQSPFMVLMQQGGQLKDIFGGIGPALKGVGGYVAGLVNPFTIAAAAIGTLGVAYFKAQEEQENFNKALILTGNYAGLTASKMSEMAKAMEGKGITQNAAAKALAEVAGTGRFSAKQIDIVTQSVLALDASIGQTADKTIANFQKIYENPTKASKELNDELHYLTASQYEYISALERKGDKEEAAEAAANAYSSAMKSRSDAAIANLGLIESAIKSATNRWAEFWNAALNVGRPMTEQYQLDQVNKAINQIYADRKRSGKGDLFDTGLQNLLSQKKGLEFVIQSQQGYANAQAKSNEINEKGIEAQDVLNKYLVSGTTAAEKRTLAQKELNKAIADNAAAAKAGKSNLWTAEDIAKARAGIEKQFKDPKTPKTPKGKAYSEDAATRTLDQLNQQYASLQSQYDTTEKIGTAQQALIKWEQQLSDIKTKKTLTADQKSLLANQQTITAQLQKNAALEKEISLRKDADKLTAFKNTLSSGLQNDAIGLQNDLSSNTVLSREQKRQQELTKITADYQKKRVELTNQRTTGQLSQNLYDQETQALQQALNQRLSMQQAYYSQLDQLNGNWQLGVQNGMQSYLNSVPTLYESVTSATMSIFTSTENAISSNMSAMLEGTKSISDGFQGMAKGMAESVVDALTKMAAQWLVYQAVQMLVGKTTAVGAQTSMIGQAMAMSQIAAINAYASAAAIPITGWVMAPGAMAAAQAATAPLIAAVTASSSLMTAGAGFSSGGYTGPGGKYQAAGMVHKGEYVFDKASTNRIGVSQLEALRNGKPLDATLGRPGYGTGLQSVSNNQQSHSTMNATINQTFNTPGVTPDQMALSMAQTQKSATRDALDQVAFQIQKGQGKVGMVMRGKYGGRKLD